MYKYILSFLGTVLCATTVFSFPHLLGYSGATGSQGTCATSCHGFSGGTIQITGFPNEYVPGAIYTVMISHEGGDILTQFNGSCRIGLSTPNAGVISAGTNTSTYSVLQETNGIHFSNINQASGTFQWTAPPQGTGEVTLYIAGLQGGYGGLNSTLSFTATESSGCCIPPLRGNVDYNPSDAIDISDLVYLVDYMFTGGSEPPCWEEGNVDGSGPAAPPDEGNNDIDISDLVHIVDFMFSGGSPPALCP